MRCVIIAGSPDTSVEFIKREIKEDDFVICADKGYFFAKEAGIIPNLAVGDFDSYDGEIDNSIETVNLNPEKNDSDTFHSIDIALKKGYNEFVILGAVGGRLDHSYANLCALAYIAANGGRAALLSEKERVELVSGRRVVEGCMGKTFSVFPFGCESIKLSYIGAKYPLNGFTADCKSSRCLSNVFESDNAEILVSEGTAVLIINEYI